MKSMKPVEVLNDNMENLIDYLKHKLKILGMANGLSDSQISDMERDFIARLAFAAIIGDEKEDEEDCESCPAKDHCSFKEPEEPERIKTFPDEVWNALRFVKNYCKDHECDNCPVASVTGVICHLNDNPSEWEI